MKLKVSEIFYSLQGEGIRAGQPTIFIRLQGCTAKNACVKSGIQCDTEFESGKEYTVEELLVYIMKIGKGCKWITWTGGEPTDQLTAAIVDFFNDAAYKQSIETSGIRPVPAGLDLVSVSPKVAEHILAKNFPNGVTELRYVRHAGQEIPQPSIVAEHYMLSPHSDGFNINTDNLKHCIRLCLENPVWRLSVQQHKIYGVL